MSFSLIRQAVPVAIALFAAPLATAHAQTAPAQVVPSPATPNDATPPGGIARGVIKPNRPVDSTMVKPPPTRGQHKMPVIKPPGIAR
ncbi:MAG: hypothetical protein RQ966_13340 [Acetobacteraceae bacterium]|nr:hypothetical protein [Acetobacteraceae bacterium]